MATTNGVQTTNNPPGNTNNGNSSNRRNQVMIGELPNDFLRAGPVRTQEQEDERIARIIQAQQQSGMGTQMVTAANFAGRLSISLVQANLTKNYGFTKMDPFCRVRLGHTVFETPTAYNGAKTPRWNKTVTTYLPQGVDSMYLEIYDERSFTPNERIAWSHIRIPESVMNGETVEESYPLSGKQGDDKEGTINLVLSLTPPIESNYNYTTPVPMMMPVYYPTPTVMGQTAVYPPQQQQMQQHRAPQQPMFTEEDVKTVKDMFPNMEEEVIKSVLEANGGNKDATINSLLSMCTE